MGTRRVPLAAGELRRFRLGTAYGAVDGRAHWTYGGGAATGRAVSQRRRCEIGELQPLAHFHALEGESAQPAVRLGCSLFDDVEDLSK